jgi:arsenate reductase (thioredoxin)
MTRPPQVLFVCIHNAGRSQMAAAFLDRYAGGRIAVRSAGSAPADEVSPVVVEAMQELTNETVEASDVVITMGCGDACPTFPGKRYLDWELEDPSGRSITDVRRIRDDIDRRVRDVAEELAPRSP